MMRKNFSALIILITIWLVACTIPNNNEFVEQPQSIQTPTLTKAVSPEPSRLHITPISSSTSIATLIHSATPVISSTATITSPESMVQPTDIVQTDTIALQSSVKFVASVRPERNRFVPRSEIFWWSEDNDLLYYQNSQTQEAWAYDVMAGISSPVIYTPRSFYELAPNAKLELSKNDELFSISPRNNYVLYKKPLPEIEPIVLNKPAPAGTVFAYTSELWLYKDGENFNLGKIDDCFGILEQPIWSENENIAVVNTAGSIGYACLYDVWMIDLDNLSVRALDTPWEKDDTYYSVRDLSMNGELLLIHVHTDMNYLYNTTTFELTPLSIIDTDNAILVNTNPNPSIIVIEYDISVSQKQVSANILYYQPIIDKISHLATISGDIIHHNISSNNQFMAFTVDYSNLFSETDQEEVDFGVWLLSLP